MSLSISSAAQAQAVAPAAPPPAKPAAAKRQDLPPTAAQAPPATAVNLSQTAVSALQEATETSAQTAREAGHGDPQAQKLLAKQAAEKAPPESHHVVA